MEPSERLKTRSGADLPVALRDGESVLIKGRVSGAIYWKAVVALTISVLVTIIIHPNLGVFLGLASFTAFLYAYLLRSFLLLIVTNQRVFFRSGLIKVDTVQLRLDKIESVEIQRTLVGHLLKYGTILITGTGSRLAYIPYLSNAAEVRNVIDDLLYQREKSTTSPS
jgi:hypothetical protein